MTNVVKKKEKPTEEKVGQVKPQHVKDLKRHRCVVPAWSNVLNHTHKLLLCKYIVNLPWLFQCTTKALKLHTASHLQHVFNGAGGAHAAIAAASNMHSSLGESDLIAQTAATRPQTLLGLDLWVTSRVLFVSFNPVSGPSSYLPRSTFYAAQGVPRLCFPLGAALSTP